MSLKDVFEYEKQELESLALQTIQSVQTKDETHSIAQGNPHLLKLFIESVKFGGEQDKFLQHCCQYTNDTEKIGILWNLFVQNVLLFKQISENCENRATFSSLDWRLECEIASKSVHAVSPASYLLKMNFSGKNESLVFSSDIPNLRHAMDSLENALKAGKTVYLKQKNLLS